MWSEDEIHLSLTRIASGYGIFQCQACADEMCQWLQDRKLKGVYIKLTRRESDFMISKRVGGHTAITQNGCHYGVEAFGKVFDNLPDTGVSKQMWLNDFECLGSFDIEEWPF